MSKSNKNHAVDSSVPAVVGWMILLAGLLHAGVFLAGDLSVLPAGLVVLVVSASGGFGLLLLASLVIAAWALFAVGVAHAVSLLLRRRSI